MTENDAIRYLDITKTFREDGNVGELQKQMCETAISALKEVQQYREIGTVEEIKSVKKYIDLKKKCGTPGNTIDLCSEYVAIGTVEECREAVEKQKPKKPTDFDGDYGYFVCPSCGCTIMADRFKDHKYCLNCGQKLDWEEENY